LEAQKSAFSDDFRRICMAEEQINPNALTVVQVARLLTRSGASSVTPAMIETDLAAGAPRNPNGTINLVHYGAWLVKEMGRSGE
jgi:hypothetical protein